MPGGWHASTIAVEGSAAPRPCAAAAGPHDPRPDPEIPGRGSAAGFPPWQTRRARPDRSPARNGRHGASSMLPPQRMAPSLRARKAGRSERVDGAIPAFSQPSAGQRRGAQWRPVASFDCWGGTTGRVAACPRGRWQLQSEPTRVYTAISYGISECTSDLDPRSSGACQPRDPRTLSMVCGSLAIPCGGATTIAAGAPAQSG